MKPLVLILDDDFEVIAIFRSVIGDEYEVCIAGTCAEALRAFENNEFSIAFLDMVLPDGSGLDVLESLKKAGSSAAVIMVSGAAGIDDAVRAVKLGAYDFLDKPVFPDRITIVLRNIAERRSFIEIAANECGIMTTTDLVYQSVLDFSRRVANSSAPIVIQAESGAGKEVLARYIHACSDRRNREMVRVNCSAIPESLFESEFFGHEKGAFTGAYRTKLGKFESADHGTLFLDELGELPLSQQAKLLRVLEESEITRVGAEKPTRIDTRIIAATNQDLRKMVEAGTFREDLFFRLNVIALRIPPLRERPGDIGALARFFMDKLNKEQGGVEKTISNRVLEQLKGMPLPGNARELRNIIQRLYYLCETSTITEQVFDRISLLDRKGEEKGGLAQSLFEPMPLIEARRRFEKAYLSEQIRENGHNISHTARSLGMIPNNLFRRIKDLDIELPRRS